jgi:hypothetical protein
MAKHRLKDGESLVSVARAYGFLDWHPIYDHAGNERLRKLRQHPNALCVGDEILIPEKVEQPLTYATGKRHQVKVVVGRGVWNLRWSEPTARCGRKVKLTGETNLPDGDLKLVLRPRELPSPKLPAVTVKVKDGKFSYEWEVKDVAHANGDTPPKVFNLVHLDATSADTAIACNTATLTVEAAGDAAMLKFDESRAWNGFANHSRFEQSLEKFVNRVAVKLDVLKGWGGTYVDLRSAGIAGTAGGCPWDGHRWARPAGLSMVPAQYYDGSNWVALPAGFTPSPSTYQAVGFYKSGSGFVGASGGTWPQPFTDYDFNGADYTSVRDKWCKQVHDQWSDQYVIGREGCKSDKSVSCCRSKVDVVLTFHEVTTHSADVVLLAPGALRSNAGLWFMGETSNMTAHETGHTMDNPDEYADGATDPAIGINPDCIMGQKMTKVEKRHYHAFAEMTGRLAKAAIGGTDTYKVSDK